MLVTRITRTPTRTEGFRTIHSVAGEKYQHDFLVVENADERAVECIEKRVNGELVEPMPTKAVVEKMNLRGYKVIRS